MASIVAVDTVTSVVVAVDSALRKMADYYSPHSGCMVSTDS